MKLIDPDVLKKKIVDARDKRMEEKPYGWEWEYNAYNHCIMIAGTLTVREPVDAVPVIRCKDCKYNPYTQNLEASVAEVVHGTTGQCWSFATNPQRYCSMAERKEE